MLIFVFRFNQKKLKCYRTEYTSDNMDAEYDLAKGGMTIHKAAKLCGVPLTNRVLSHVKHITSLFERQYFDIFLFQVGK